MRLSFLTLYQLGFYYCLLVVEKFLEKSGGNTGIYFGCHFSHEHHLVMRTLQLRGLVVGWGGCCKPAHYFAIYITSRFAYMKHLFS